MAKRHSLIQKCLVRPMEAPGTGTWHGIAYNLSTTGIGLVLPWPVCPGVTLVIEPWGLANARTLLARVVRSTPIAFTWFLGCELANPLADEELRAWLP